MRKFFKLIFSKFFIFSLILLAEIGILVFFVLFLNSTIHSAIFTGITIALDVIFVLYIINSDINAEYKIAWIVPDPLSAHSRLSVLYHLRAQKTLQVHAQKTDAQFPRRGMPVREPPGAF